MKKIGLVGYSGHALVVAEILNSLNIGIAGYFEKEPIKSNPLNLSYLGYERSPEFIEKAQNLTLFVAIGDNNIRMNIINYLRGIDVDIATLVSPKSIISSSVNIDIGSLVCFGAIINPFAQIGKGVIVNTGAVIEHECKIGNFSHIASGAVLAGNVHIGENTLIGANSALKQGISVGKNVIVGAGSVVVRDIPDNGVWVGNPVRRIK
jgi:sugar O-acyltransferase (sialic acid O-acetyltransferase NeuD family)